MLLLLSCYVVSETATPWTAVCQVPLSSTISWTCSYSCPLSQWCYLTILSSATLFSFCLQSFLSSGSFPMNQLFTSGGQSIGVSAPISVLTNEYLGLISFRTDWFDLLAVQGTLKSLLWHCIQKHQFFGAQPSLSHTHTWLLEKPQLWLYRTLLAKWYLCFVICCLCLSQLFFQGARGFFCLFVCFVFNLMAVVTIHSDFGAQENKICHCFHFLYLPWSDGTGAKTIISCGCDWW